MTRPVTWSFLAPTLVRPTGGDIAMFEVVNALARIGQALVRVVHVPLFGEQISSVADVPWFDFEPSVVHHFPADLEPGRLPATDVVVFSTKLLATALSRDGGAPGQRLISALTDPGDRGWQTVLFLQGLGVFSPQVEDLARTLPGAKVCVGSWLARQMVEQGAPPANVVHIPNGLDPRAFRLVRPIEGRPAHASMNFDPHPVKGGRAGLTALDLLHRAQGVRSTVFGTRPPSRPLADGVSFVAAPQRPAIAGIYNASSMFLQASDREGFGMCAVEAMACGAALVTTANGGSDDYAVDGETALICAPDAEAMHEALTRLVHDDALRVRLATAGARFVERFRWSTTAERLVQFVDADRARNVG
jgi:hypothetical protein